MKFVFFRKTLCAIISLAGAYTMYLAMKYTAPATNTHASILTEKVVEMADYLFTEKIVVPEESKKIATYLYHDAIPKMVDKIIYGKIDLTDLDVVSFGTMTDEDGETHLVTLGIFGKVYTFNEDMVMTEVERSLEQEIESP